MCNLAIDYPDYAERVQTVIHELSHFDAIAATSDNTYGEQACYQLANGASASFTAASTCADSMAYYAIYVNTCYRHYNSPTTTPSPYTASTPPCKSCAASSTYPNAGARQAISCGASSAPTAIQPTASPTALDSCQWAKDAACDEPTYCDVGTDCTDCGNCATGTPTTSTANMPTAAPTRKTFSAAFAITLQGTNSSGFSTAAKEAFENVIANNAGNVCGYNGVSRCSGDTDVTLKGWSRRGALAVTFTLDTYSEPKANTALSTLKLYIPTTNFVTDLTTAGSMTATSAIVVTSTVSSGSSSGSPDDTWGITNGATTTTVFSLTTMAFVLGKCFI